MSFDADDFFNSKYTETGAAPGITEYNFLLDKKRASTAALQEEHRRALETLRQRKFQADQSWGGQWEPGLLKDAAQLGAHTVSGLANAAESAGSALVTIPAYMRELKTPQHIRDAYDRVNAGGNNPEDIALLNQRVVESDPTATVKWGEYITRTDDIYDYADKTNTSITDQANLEGIIDETSRSHLSDDIGDTYRGVTGDPDQGAAAKAVNLLVGIGDNILDNPSGTMSHILEEIPELAFGGASKTALSLTNLGYGLEAYRDGLKNYREDHGKSPDDLERARMMTQALGSVGLEQFADKRLLKPFEKAIPSGAVNRLDEAARLAGTVPGTKTAGKTLGSAVTEGATEAAQTYLEGEARNRSASGEEIYEAATIGAGVGGGITGPAHLVGNAAEATTKVAEKTEQARQKTAAVVEASQTGDVDNLIEAKDYTAASVALYRRSINKSLSSDDRKVAKEKLDSISTDLIKQQEETENELTTRKEQLKTAKQSEDNESVELLEAVIPELEAEVEKLNTEVANVSQGVLKAQREAEGTESVDSLVSTIESADTTVEETESASRKLLVQAMISPESVSVEKVEAIVANTDNGLSDTQRSNLKILGQAQRSIDNLKDMDKVQGQDIMGSDPREVTGSPEFRNIQEYRKQFAAALASGNNRGARRLIGELQAFQTNQANKAQAAKQALNDVQQAKSNGQAVRRWLVPGDNGAWEVTEPQRGVRNPQSQGIFQTSSKGSHPRALERLVHYTEAASTALADLGKAFDVTFQDQTKVSEPTQQLEAEKKQSYKDNPPAGGKETPTPEQVSDYAETQNQADQQQDNQPEEKTQPVDAETARKESNRTVHKELSDPARINQEVKQNAGPTADSGSQRPLVAQDNFMSEDLTVERVAEYLKDSELDERQQDLLTVFNDTLKEWLPALRDLMQPGKTNPDFNHQNPVLMLGDSINPENVETAIMFAAFSYIQENGGANRITDAEIRGLTGKTDANGRAHESITSEERQEFDRPLIDRDQFVSGLGQRAAQVLGLTQVDESSDPSLMTRLENSLGGYGMALLVDADIIERRNITSGLFDPEIIAKAKHSQGNVAERSFVVFNKDWEAPLDSFADGKRPLSHESAERIYQAGKETGSVLQRLFNAEQVDAMPSDQPGTFYQETAKSTEQEISATQKRIAKKVSKEPHTLQEDVVTLLDALDDEVLIGIGGGKPEGYKAHAVNQDSYDSKREALQREVDNYRKFADVLRHKPSGLESKFYFVPDIWRQFRAGLKSGSFNIQSYKLHRASTFMDKHQTSFNLVSQSDKDRAREKLFKLAVGQALGIPVDKQSQAASVTAFNEEYRRINGEPSSDLAIAVKGLQAVLNGGALSQEASDALVRLSSSEEGFHTMNGLLHLARYHEAMNGTADTFATNIVMEVDGVTNGPVLSSLALGIDDKKLLEAGGFFDKESNYTNIPEWTENVSNLDLYKQVADGIWETQLEIDTDRDIVNAVNQILGLNKDESGLSKGARNLVKTPTTAMFFGANLEKTTREDMFSEFLNKIYSQAEDILNETNPAEQEFMFTELNNALEVLVGGRIESLEALQAEALPGKAVARLREHFTQVIAEPTEQVMETKFSAFIERRNKLNGAANELFKAYESAKEQLESQYVKELMDSGDMPFTEGKGGKRIPKKGLTKAQTKELRKRLKPVLPIVHTAFSKKDGNLNAGYQIGKLTTRSTKEDKDSPYNGLVQLGKAIDQNGRKSARVETHGTQKVESEPGAATVVSLTHAMDSYIASLAYEEVPATNIHDALLLGLDQTLNGAIALNKATYEAMLGYSIPMEIANTMERMVTGFGELGLELPKGFESVTNELRSDAEQMERDKLTVLFNTGSVNQYGFEGGDYVLTQDDRTDIIRQADQYGMVDEKHKAKKTVWGYLGNSSAAVDSDLESLLVGKDKVSAPAVLKSVIQVLNGRKDTESQHQAVIARELRKALPDSVQIQMVYPDTDPATLPNDASRELLSGTSAVHQQWDNGERVVYLKAPGFVQTNLSMETLLHELIHAATSHHVNRLGDGSPELQALEDIRTKVSEYIAANPDKFPEGSEIKRTADYGVQDIHELLAMGLTNTEFQHEVLANVDMGKDVETGGMLNGLKALMKWVVGILKLRNSNALVHLYSASSELIQQSQQRLNEPASVTSRPQAAPSAAPVFSFTGTFDALGLNGDTTPHTQHLRKILVDVTQAVLGKGTPWDVESYVVAQQQGMTPFSDKARGLFNLTAQESFVLETTQLAMKAALEDDRGTYQHIRDVFTQSRDALTPADVGGQAAYDFLFELSGNGGKSEYLSRFIAVAMVQPAIAQKLDTVILKDKAIDKNETLWNRLVQGLYKALNRLSLMFAGAHHKHTAGNRLDTLVRHMVSANIRRQQMAQSKTLGMLDTFTNKAVELSEGFTEKTKGIFTKGPLAKSDNPVLATIRNISSISTDNPAEALFRGAMDVRNDFFKNKQLGTFASIANEMMTETDDNQRFYSLLQSANQVEQHRQALNDRIQEEVQGWFQDSQELTKEDWDAMTRVGLRIDLSSLTGRFSVEDIEQLLSSPQRLFAEIELLEKEIKANAPNQMAAAYIHDARSLGLFLATGKVGTEMLRTNAHQIANQMGDVTRNKHAQRYAQNNIEAIDMLASLHGIQHMDSDMVNRFVQVIKRENQRKDGNGIQNMLGYHALLKQDALKVNFNGNPTQMMKGYTKDTYNPHIDVQVVDKTDTRQMEEAGFVVQELLSADPQDLSGGNRVLMTRYGGGLKHFVTASTSFTGLRSRGTKLNSGMSTTDRSRLNVRNAREIRDVTTGKLGTHSPSVNHDPEAYSKQGARMVPIFNEQGNVAGYRYMMTEANKDNIMERNNQVFNVLGTMTGHAYDKVASAEQNKMVVESLKEQHALDVGIRDSAYIEFGPNSTDPEIRETYLLLPESTKDHIREIWGDSTMYVRNDLYDMVFGYRARSVVSSLEKRIANWQEQEQNSLAGRIIVDLLLHSKLLSPKALHRIRQAEDGWQELVKMMKDNIVIKSFEVLFDNIVSNTVLLATLGVPPHKIAKYYAEGIRGITDYNQDSKELFSLQTQIRLGLTGTELKKAQQRIIELEDAINRNPVKELIDAGMLQTIVEDVSNADDEFSYGSKLARWVDKKTEGVPEKAKVIGKNLFLTHDTEIYKFLNNSTHYSDFVARYILHKHMTERKRHPMSSQEAMTLAMKAFVNYDVPTHRNIQYMNDMGFLLFTKYFFRIQNVILHLWHKEPARGLITVLLTKYLGDIPSVFDSTLLTRLGNPLEDGILGYPDSVAEIITLDLLGGPG